MQFVFVLKVLVTEIVDASHYYVRVLSVRKEDKGEQTDLSASYSVLQMDMGTWYGNLLNRKRHSKLYCSKPGYNM